MPGLLVTIPMGSTLLQKPSIKLVGDNLDHLQDNMRLTAHINSSQEWMAQMEHRLGQVRSVVMGFLEGRLESLMEEEEEEMTELSNSLEAETSGASGNGLDDSPDHYWQPNLA